jgi:putative ABC transport system permease protein
VSAAASEAVQIDLHHLCLADAGVSMVLVLQHESALAALDVAASAIRGVTPRVLTGLTGVFPVSVVGDQSDTARRFVLLLSREGQEKELGAPVPALGQNETLLPDWFRTPVGIARGDHIAVTEPPIQYSGELGAEGPVPAAVLDLTVDGTYPEIPVRPEPAFWCGFRSLFRPTGLGDRPTPVAIVSSATLHAQAAARVFQFWEMRPNPAGMSRHDAALLADEFDHLLNVYTSAVGVSKDEYLNVPRREQFHNGLHDVVHRAGVVADVVGRTMAPVRLAGLAAALALLIASGVLVTRERAREMRLRLLRGVGPVALGARVAWGIAVAAVIGTVIGGLVALFAVRAFGPTSLLEPGPVREAIISTTIGLVCALVVVGGAAAVVARRLVDARRRERTRHWPIPWEVAIVALAVASYLRLERVGGVRLVGANAQGGDLLAQAFPLLAVAAPLALVVRPARFMLRRARLAGGKLRPAVLLGIRRAIAEPGITLSLVLASALAAGSFAVSTILTDSARGLLDDKAGTYLGSDLVVTTDHVAPLPPPLADSSTIVVRTQARSGGLSVDVLGVDPDTFARAVRWRADAADESLPTLLAKVAHPPPGALPAIVAGGEIADGDMLTYNLQHLSVRPVASARWFPGYHNGAPLLIVDRDALVATGLALNEEAWMLDPPADAAQLLQTAGFVVRSPQEASEVLDVTSFLTVRWSYASLSAFGVLIGVVLLLAQLLVLDARRGARQTVHLLTTSMGMRRRDTAVAVVSELAPPLLSGIVLGLGIGWAVSRIAVRRLDTLRQLQPPARVVVESMAIVPVVLATIAALALLVLVGLTAIARTRPMEVMRGTA